MSLMEAFHFSDAILFSCDSNAIITIQEGGGLQHHNIRNGQHIGLNTFEVFKDLPEFTDALRLALTGQPTHAVYKWGKDFCETQLKPTPEGGVVGICTIQTERVLKEKEAELEIKILSQDRAKRSFVTTISHEIKMFWVE